MSDSSSPPLPVKPRFRVALLLGAVVLVCVGAVCCFLGRRDEDEGLMSDTLHAAVVSWRALAFGSDDESGHFPSGPADLSPGMTAHTTNPKFLIYHPGPAMAYAAPGRISWVPVRGRNTAAPDMDALMLVLPDPRAMYDGIPRYYCAFVRRRGLFSEKRNDEPRHHPWLEGQTSTGSFTVNLESENSLLKYEYEGNRGRTPYTLEEIMQIHTRLLQDANASAP